MKLKTLTALLIAALLLTGCGSGTGAASNESTNSQQTAEESSVSVAEESSNTPTDAEAISNQATENENAEINEADTSQMNSDTVWQNLYKDILADVADYKFDPSIKWYGLDINNPEFEDETDEAYATYLESVLADMVAQEYYLTDIDKNGTPELIIRLGDCEANYYGMFFGVADGQLVDIGGTNLGHTSLYTYKDQNGLLLHEGHMGYESITKITLTDGALQFEDLSNLDRSNEDDYTDLSTIAEDLLYLRGCPLYDLGCINCYRQWEKNCYTTPEPADTSDPESDAAYLDLMKNNGTLIRDSLYSYITGAEPRKMTFEEFLAPKGADQWGEYQLKVDSYCIIDLDQDGTNECMLILKAADESQDENGSYTDYALLSWRNETMYAWFMDYVYGDSELLENGSFSSTSAVSFYPEYSTSRIAIGNGEIYLYYSLPDTTHSKATWTKWE